MKKLVKDEKQNKTSWQERFDYLTDSDNFAKGQFQTLLGEHLFDSDWYPESPYELCSEKIKNFIRIELEKEYQRGFIDGSDATGAQAQEIEAIRMNEKNV